MLKFAAVAAVLALVPVIAHAEAIAEQKQCRYITPTGSYFGTKVCKTRKDWAANDRLHEDAVAKAQRNNTLEYSQGKGNRILP